MRYFILIIILKFINSTNGFKRNKTLNILFLDSPYSNWYAELSFAYAVSLLHSQTEILPEFNVTYYRKYAGMVGFILFYIFSVYEI